MLLGLSDTKQKRYHYEGLRAKAQGPSGLKTIPRRPWFSRPDLCLSPAVAWPLGLGPWPYTLRVPFTVGIIQDHADPEPAKNLARAERLVREAASRGAQIICLKELFNSLYFCKTQQCDRFDLAEPIPGPTTDALQRLARELAVVIVVPIFERQAAGIYRNSAAIIDADGSLLGVYRKMHIPDDPLFNEKYYFTPGDGHLDYHGERPGEANGFKVWKTRYATIG